MSLTVAAIQKLKPTKVRREVPDVNGLRLLVHPSGSKVWVMRFRRPGTSKLCKMTLGPLDLSGHKAGGEPVVGQPLSLVDARRLVSAIQRERAMGRDVVADRQAEQRRKSLALDDAARNTFVGAARDYVEQERRAKQKNRGWRYSASTLGLSYAGDDSTEPTLIKGGLAERWCDRPISSITADELNSLVDEARERAVPGRKLPRPGPSDSRAREMAGTLMAMFKWLARKRRIAVNPAVLDKPAPSRPRDRVLSDAELRWFSQAGDQLGEPFGPLLRMLLLTGARRDEIGALRWSELSDDSSAIALSGARTKNGLPHIIPLATTGQQLLAGLTRIVACPFAFSTNGRTPVSGFSKIKARLDSLMLKIARDEALQRGDDPEQVVIAPWRIHDLRRTCATGMGEHCGVAPHIVEACLNHISGARSGVAGTYNRALYLQERRAALEAWARHVGAVAAAGNIVPIRERA